MNLHELTKVEDYKFYIDVAFKKAKKTAELSRETKKKESRLERSRTIELKKIEVIRKVLSDKLMFIVQNFPNFDQLPIFYQELIREEIGYSEFKKSLGALSWARDMVNEYHRKYRIKIIKSSDITIINQHRREYYGRISSFLKQIKTNFEFLDEARKKMRHFPGLKTKMFTVAIAGFPNVGKTTLLSKLTVSNPEVNSYPFTTKGVMVGFIEDKNKIQLLDTPGTLNRNDKMNLIEKRAFLAIKYLSNVVVYVFDLTELYPLDEQEKLFRSIKKLDKNVIIYLSKTDLIDEIKIVKFRGKHKDAIIDFLQLKKKIISCSQQAQ